jgi:hypothetical protein
LLSLLIIFFLAALLNELDPSNAALDQPLPQSFPGVKRLSKHQSHVARPATGSTVVVFFVGWLFLEERCFVV